MKCQGERGTLWCSKIFPAGRSVACKLPKREAAADHLLLVNVVVDVVSGRGGAIF